ncbi:MAG: rhomboid family intramembrane serine protease [Candidatus Eremiobacteraeota bacterium]|nr:rhomboid family intramembrane serine protease [Candidatus Eremiobacteraeota bacterium]
MKPRAAVFTTSMLALCWVVFILDAVASRAVGGVGAIGSALALIPEDVLAGQWWRVVTYGFVHAGIAHIVVNSIALFQAGDVVEYIYGTRAFAAIYIAALIGGGLAAFFTTVGTGAITVGASGAIMGIFGAMLVLGWKVPPLRRELVRSAVVPIVLVLLYGLFLKNISNAAHIGGLIMGGLAALFLTPKNAREMIRLFQSSTP